MDKKANDALRAKYTEIVKEMLAAQGEQVLTVGSNEIALPVVDNTGEDNWVTIVIKVPTGSRDGDLYDGYAMEEDYKIKQKNKAEKAKEAAAAKARKIARDEAERAAKKAAREQRKKEAEAHD